MSDARTPEPPDHPTNSITGGTSGPVRHLRPVPGVLPTGAQLLEQLGARQVLDQAHATHHTHDQGEQDGGKSAGKTKAKTGSKAEGKTETKEGKDAGGEDGSRSQASMLVKLATESYDLVLGEDGRPYAVDRDGPVIAVPLRGRDGLRTRMARTFYARTGTAPAASALADALTVIEGMTADAQPVPVALRVARHGASVVLDLGDPTGRAIVVQPGSWHLAETSPVLFRRTALTHPLPIPGMVAHRLDDDGKPQRSRPDGGTRGSATVRQAARYDTDDIHRDWFTGLAPFRALLNVDDDGFSLLIGWLLAALIADIPHPILALTGEQGTAKSTAARFMVTLFDPSPAPLRTPPRDVRQWSVTAAASWSVALDNVSTIPAWLSDTLCKAVTGDGIVDRALFTDDDVTVLSFRRVIAMTSIDAGALAGDLAERLVPVELQRIDPTQRRSDEAVNAAFRDAHPITLGALLELLSAVLAALPNVQLEQLPRMADFARLLAALDDVTGWSTLSAYTAAAGDITAAVLEADPLATAVRDLIDGQAVGWTGTAGQLLELLTPNPAPRVWPRTPRALSGQLRRLAPALRASGIGYDAVRTNGTRLISLIRLTTSAGDGGGDDDGVIEQASLIGENPTREGDGE